MSALGRWFQLAWRDRGKRRDAALGYAVLRERPLVLADIALRGSVYQPILDADPVLAARAEGRRQLALEILGLAGMDPARLLPLIDPPEHKPKDRP